MYEALPKYDWKKFEKFGIPVEFATTPGVFKGFGGAKRIGVYIWNLAISGLSK